MGNGCVLLKDIEKKVLKVLQFFYSNKLKNVLPIKVLLLPEDAIPLSPSGQTRTPAQSEREW